ncbi:MAG: anti-sigma factor antagonist [Fusobacteria bacterium]|nr:anti-sigma factor antagonist [Fusobacteriota bacterium]
MKAKKIGIIMEKNKIRDKILINFQRNGYKIYVIPEDEEIISTIKKMNLSLIIISKSEQKEILEYLSLIKGDEELEEIPVLITLDKNMENSDIVKILKNGATDIVYVKDENIIPILNMVNKFWDNKPSKFEMETREIEEIYIIKITGNIDLSSNFKLQNKVSELLKEGVKNFIINMEEIDYIESVGISTMVQIKKNIEQKLGEIKFVIKSSQIKKLISMVKLDKYFEIHNDVHDIIEIPGSLRKIKVVIIDDGKFMRKLISDTLKIEGFETIEFESALVALDEIQNISPDLILVDYEMPDMNGLDFIKKFNPQLKGIPTVMLTTERNIDIALKAIRLGAADFLNKPFDRYELIEILKKIDRGNKLKQENERLFFKLKRREKELERKNRELSKLYEALEDELEMASEIQKNLLPIKFPEIPGYNFAVKYQPSQDIGGDFYDIVSMSNGYYGIAFADVSGHGIPAALLSTMFKVYLMTYSEDIISPAETMELLNDVVVKTFPEGKFISLFYLVIKLDDNKVMYCKAAQEPGILIKKDGTIEELITKGQVLGLFSEEDFPGMIEFEEKELVLDPGDKIFLYTDGIIEAQNKDEIFYGIERLKELLAINHSKKGQELLDIVYGDLMDYLEGLPVIDDLTMFVIEKE